MNNRTIVYYMCTTKPLSGAQINLLDILSEIGKTTDTDVYYVNNYFEQDIKYISGSKITYLNICEEIDKAFSGAIFITALNYLPKLVEYAHILSDNKICLYCYDYYSSANLKKELKFLNNDYINTLVSTNSIFYADRISIQGAINTGYIDSKPCIIPYVTDFDGSTSLALNCHNEQRLNVGFVVNGFGTIEKKALMDLIENVNQWINQKAQNDYSKVIVTIYVFGIGSMIWDLGNVSIDNISLVFVGSIFENIDYLDKKMDMVFSRGKEALVSAARGIPTLLFIADKNKTKRNAYVDFVKTLGYSLYFSGDAGLEVGQEFHTLEYFFEKYFNAGSSWRQETVSEIGNYSLAKNAGKLLEFIDNTSLTIGSCEKLGLQTTITVSISPKRSLLSLKTIRNSINIFALKSDKIIHIIARKIRYYKVQARYNKAIKEIREDIKCNKKIKVAFLIIFDSVFPLRIVFEKMIGMAQFDPYIVAIPNVSRTMSYQIELLEKTYNIMNEKYPGRVLKAYNSENNTYLDLKNEYKFIFFANPYKNLVHPYHDITHFIKCNVLTVFANYGFAALNFWNEYLDSDFYNYLWLACIETKDNYDYLKAHQTIHARNAIVTGYIKMDMLSLIKKERRRKKIIISPHHTVWGWKTLNVSNFLKYKDFFISLPHKYPQIDFVFRPHPLLFPNLINYLKWTQKDVDDYINKLLSSPNVMYDTSADYMEVFQESDAMIHDCGSFIGEYLYTGNPCCYLMKTEEETKHNLLPFGEKCINQYYHAFSEEDICSFIDNVVLKGKDPKKEERDRFRAEELMINYPNSADILLDYIMSKIG